MTKSVGKNKKYDLNKPHRLPKNLQNHSVSGIKRPITV